MSLDIKSPFSRGKKKESFIFLTPDMTNFKGVMHYLHRPSLINLFFAGGWVHKIEEESSLAE